ncbi:MAG: response regulator [Prevotella sp.]|nr:response regulator [Prevotella sp.]
MKRLFLSFFLIVLTTMSGLSQVNYRQRQLTIDNGLASNSISCITQDSRGFIWIGTSNGLSRYDGVTATNFMITNDDGDIINTYVTSLLPEDNGDMLVGTTNGLYRFRYVPESFEPIIEDIDTVVRNIVRDKQGTLWISTWGQGVYSYNATSGQTRHYPMDAAKGIINYIYSDNDNRQWLIANGGHTASLWRLDKSKDEFTAVELKGNLPSPITAMLQTSNGQLWLGTWEHGLALLDQDSNIQHMAASAPGHCQNLHAMFELSEQQILLACDDGLWLFDTRSHTYEIYQTSPYVQSIARDHEGGLWTGTAYNGVSYSSPIAHRFTGVSDGLSWRFCEDHLGRMWVAGENGNVICYQNGKKVSFNNEEKLHGMKPYSFIMDGNDLWIGTFGDGVYVYNTQTGRLRHYEAASSNEGLFDPNSCTLLRDSKGAIWVVTMGGLCRYNRQGDRFEHIMKKTSLPIDIEEDSKGRLWIATQGEGIWRYDGNEKTKAYRHEANNETSLSDNIINCLVIDGKGIIWAATQGGLCRYDEAADNFQRIHLDVPQQAVAAMAEDQGVLWLSSDNGIMKYEPEKSLLRFTRHDGLEGEHFLRNAVTKTSDGRLYFGSISGFNSFYPHLVTVNQQQAPVFITQLEINNDPIPVGNWHLPKALAEIEKLDLYYNDNVFSLSFASLSYCSPEKNMYAYMLEGFDKTWNYVGHEHKATYTNLSPGVYTFRVKATNNDGVWSEKEARLIIEIHPPFWWNIYAKTLYVILFALFIIAFIRLRIMYVERRHRKEMEQLNKTKQEELHNARVEFFTTIAHEIRTPVSLIIGPLEQVKSSLAESASTPKGIDSQLDVIERNAHRLLELVNQLLDFRKLDKSQADVNFAPQNMRELMSNIAANFETTFQQSKRQLIINYPDETFTPVIDREGMVKLLSNLLSNANKYTKDKITLSCRVIEDGKQFCLEVSDNGYGISKEDQKRVFDPFFQTKDRKPGTGIGLSIVKKIAEQHHGTVEVLSELGKGTTFRITLPSTQEISGEPVQPERQEHSNQTLEEISKNASEVVQQQKPSMLIVDDNEDMLTFLVTTFMDRFEVTPARDGSEALKILENSLVVKDGHAPTSTVDIIISDWMMEQMDGPELCSRMRQNAATNQIPFILLTAKTDSQSKVAAMKAGVDAFIEKPFAVKYLEACICNLLDRRKLKTT